TPRCDVSGSDDRAPGDADPLCFVRVYTNGGEFYKRRHGPRPRRRPGRGRTGRPAHPPDPPPRKPFTFGKNRRGGPPEVRKPPARGVIQDSRRDERAAAVI